MQALKFRAWHKIFKNYAHIKRTWLDGDGDGHDEIFAVSDAERTYSGHEVVLEQYTGLKDKNGKGIYEGDIIRYTIWLRGAAKELICTKVVKWWSGEEEEWPCCTTSGFSLPHSEDGYEVIGNIHENPELLEHKG